MSILHVGHIRASCENRFSDLIDMTDCARSSDDDRSSRFLTRALAAFTIAELAKLDDRIAAQAVVDEPQDDGIDAFYYDRGEHICYLAQSKWSRDGTGSLDVGDVLKFVQGVNHFMDPSCTMQFGPRLRAKKADIDAVLADSLAKIVLIVTYTGQQPLSQAAQRPLDDLLTQINDDVDMASLRTFRLKDNHAIVTGKAIGQSVNLQVMLQEWGFVREPYKAYYGQVNVSDIFAWRKYGDYLYTKNLRGFKGNTDVNDGIVATLSKSPQSFVYFNNGITVLCDDVSRQPLGGSERNSGVFDCTGASVVNGAQTVGSIISAIGAAQPPIDARVMVRLVSLKDCPPEFGNELTRAANTQNKIEKRDFAAQDEEQSRLKAEILLTFSKEYVYRTGEQEPQPDEGCTLDEAAIALACAQPDLAYTMTAKREVSKLYDDIHQPPYIVLFNPSVGAARLWRSVEALRAVDSALHPAQTETDGKPRLIAVHGHRFVAHLVFMQVGSTLFSESADDSARAFAQVPAVTLDILDRVTRTALRMYPSAYPSNLFKNITKCRAIKDQVVGEHGTDPKPHETAKLF